MYAGDQGELPLAEVTDRAGHAITFGHGEADQPDTVTHSGGYRIDITVTAQRVTRHAGAGVMACLSRAAHHHAYELAPTAGELREWHSAVGRMADILRVQGMRA
jgi:hypothetical protein